MTAPLLVVAHEATRTGSPRVLLDLLSFIVDRIDVPIAVKLQAEGPLSGELRALATANPHGVNPCAVFVNSAAAATAIDETPPGTPSAIYVHEEGDALAVLPAAARAALTGFDRVLCVSGRSHAALVALGVDEARIEILPPVVSARTRRRSAPQSPPIVVGCGEAGWRKGADLFVDTARRIADRSDARFLWAGRRPRAFARLLDADTEAAGLSSRLEWLGEVDDVARLFESATLLLMTSREDPQPLVPLEAACFGVATVGFAIGGIRDLSDSSAAVTVAFPDTVALAGAAAELLEDGAQRMALASSAASRARSQHAVEVVGERFLSIIDAMLLR
jgi:glycosyltransferase involved in cell wall biosynthesis